MKTQIPSWACSSSPSEKDLVSSSSTLQRRKGRFPVLPRGGFWSDTQMQVHGLPVTWMLAAPDGAGRAVSFFLLIM
ncbi:hypothetical protein OJAV_G00179850 [Oryzias javanicus]|uniref:Uncharacterized protein n=1 Tax=Oryzias javanicus TaxID=123683 RepID=A0A437CD89_ORYJA|nr:hypothetical protein OJAV_G00179850 [Oryzias javanicus]